MEENKSLWNKTSAELTIGDAMKMNAIVMIVMIGGFAVIAVVSSVVGKVNNKIRGRKSKSVKTINK